MESLTQQAQEVTIIMIAHRLPTLSRCDEIIKLEEGRIVDRGSYSRMVKSQESVANSVPPSVTAD
jgi:ABC-type bacteriocin/lantibiotic exporter with double-glycine peptidase domain